MNPISKTLDQHKKANQKIAANAEAMLSIYNRARSRINDQLTKHVLSGADPLAGRRMVELLESLTKQYGQLEEAFVREMGGAIPFVAQAYYRDALNDLGKSVIGEYDPARIDIMKRDAFTHVAGMTQNMLKSDVGFLRNISADVFRESSVTGRTTSEIVRGLLAKIVSRPESFRFTDAAGRVWNNEAYCQMLARTVTLNAGRQAYFDTCIEEGGDVVRVTVSGTPCPKCAVWENRLLSISGKTKGLPTVQDATSAGLCHPNCTHSFVAVPDFIAEEDFDKSGRPKSGLNNAESPIKDNPEAWREYRKDQAADKRTIRSEKLTEQEIKAIKKYTSNAPHDIDGEPFYSKFNSYLRNRTDSSKRDPVMEEAEKEIRSAISKSVAAKNITVHRGVSSYDARQKMIHNKDGFVSLKQIESASSDKSIAEEFSDGQLMLKINVPRGSHILPVKKYSELPDEDESFLLNTGKYKIEKLYYPYGEDDILVAEVTYVE